MRVSRAISLLLRAVVLCVLVLALPEIRPVLPVGRVAAATGPAGVAWMWGYNGNGEMGDGTTNNRLSPWRVPGLSGVVAITAGASHSLALTADGSVWAWGSDEYGQLGLGSGVNGVGSPQQVPGVHGVKAIAAGQYFSLALESDGTVWAWGDNEYSGLGIDRTVMSRSLTPQQVPGLHGVKAIAAGANFGLALTSDGSVWAWGDNGSDVLGVDYNTVQQRGPPQKVAGLSGIRAIAAGNSFGLAVASDGSVWGWGDNSEDQLGENESITGDAALKPVLVPGLSGVHAIATGDRFSLALTSDGSVWSWGFGYDGQLGNGTLYSQPSATPSKVVGLSDVQAIAAGSNHGVALEANGSVWTWGDNQYGELGDGTTNGRATVAQVPGLAGMRAIAAAYGKSMAFIPASSGSAPPRPVITVTATPVSPPGPPAAACAVVTVNTFDQCVEPSVLRVVKSLPGGIVEQGSAFVIRSDSSGTYLATNQHVIDGAGKDALTVYLPDGRTHYPVAAVLSTGGTDGTVQDLALIQLQPTGLRPLRWGSSSTIHSLQQVVAVGYGDAFDLLGPPSITQGSVSATQRDLGKCGGGGWIQHDAALSHGNSGGPLLDLSGHVIGINTLKFDDQSACPTLADYGFAIPSAVAQAVLGTLTRLLPGVQGGLIGALSARIEIAAQQIPSKAATLPHVHFQVPVAWQQAKVKGEFRSRDGRVTMLLAAKSYRVTPTLAQLQADGLHALGPSAPFAGMGVGPLAINSFSGLVVTALPARHSYRADALALLNGVQHVEVVVVRQVDPSASSQDRLAADALLLSITAV